MAHSYHHALSSVKRWGGEVGDYQPIHDWFDQTKAFLADARHRALRHHAEGIFLCEQISGTTITISTGRCVPTRWVAEQHVMEDLGQIPTAAQWLELLPYQGWMNPQTRVARDVTVALADKHHPSPPNRRSH